MVDIDITRCPIKGLEDLFKQRKDLLEQVKKELERKKAFPNGDASKIGDRYWTHVLMPFTNYIDAILNLRDACESDSFSLQPTISINGETYIRSLTLKENIEWKVNDYNRLKNLDGSVRTKDNREMLIRSELSSCTGLLYGDDNIKIIPICIPLIVVSRESDGKDNLVVSYSDLDGYELKVKGPFLGNYGIFSFRESYNRQTVLNHPGWVAAVEDDKVLLREYANIVFNLLEKEEEPIWSGMRFCISPRPINSLSPLHISGIRIEWPISSNDSDYSDSMIATSSLYAGTRFMRLLKSIL